MRVGSVVLPRKREVRSRRRHVWLVRCFLVRKRVSGFTVFRVGFGHPPPPHASSSAGGWTVNVVQIFFSFLDQLAHFFSLTLCIRSIPVNFLQYCRYFYDAKSQIEPFSLKVVLHRDDVIWR